jgi:hypothetical protein
MLASGGDDPARGRISARTRPGGPGLLPAAGTACSRLAPSRLVRLPWWGPCRLADTQGFADATADAATKSDFADIADRWRRLAESYSFVERVERFLANTKPIGSMPSVSVNIDETSLLDDLHLPAGVLGRSSGAVC